jgi:hypothetical protein
MGKELRASHGRVAPIIMEKGFLDDEDGGNSEKGREKMSEGGSW